ncbi:hypothetical protein AMS68_002717 [Peltaster fructicola]|uniref:Uncharacterized protein n=1 Tax=Peltaster fructicola TaxID=286661 RepID=A0A6H0XRV3_9PEZI|nr:hypothetical protein AMS68_002717 [Peltaster fructicola]
MLPTPNGQTQPATRSPPAIGTIEVSGSNHGRGRSVSMSGNPLQQPSKSSADAEAPATEPLSRVQQVQRLLTRQQQNQQSDERSSPRHVANTTMPHVERSQTAGLRAPAGYSSPSIQRPIGPGMQSPHRSGSPLRQQESPISAVSLRDPVGLGLSFGSNATTPDLAMFPVPGHYAGRAQSPHGYPFPRPHSPHGGHMLGPSSPQRQYGISPGSPLSLPQQYPRPAHENTRPQSPSMTPRADSPIYTPPGLSAKRKVDHNLRVDTAVSSPQKLPQPSLQNVQVQREVTRQEPAEQVKKIRKSTLEKPLPPPPSVASLMPAAPPAEVSDTSRESSRQGSPIATPTPISPISPVSPIILYDAPARQNTSTTAPTVGSPVSAMTNVDEDVPPQVPLDAPSVPPIPRSIARKPVPKMTPASVEPTTPLTPPSSKFQVKVRSPTSRDGPASPTSITLPSPKRKSVSESPQLSESPVRVEKARSIAIPPLERPTIEPVVQSHRKVPSVARVPSLITLSEQPRVVEQMTTPRREPATALALDITNLPPSSSAFDSMSARSNGSHAKATSTASVPSLFTLAERADEYDVKSAVSKGIPRPDSDAIGGASALMLNRQPKLADLEHELLQEDAEEARRRLSEKATSYAGSPTTQASDMEQSRPPRRPTIENIPSPSSPLRSVESVPLDLPFSGSKIPTTSRTQSPKSGSLPASPPNLLSDQRTTKQSIVDQRSVNTQRSPLDLLDDLDLTARQPSARPIGSTSSSGRSKDIALPALATTSRSGTTRGNLAFQNSSPLRADIMLGQPRSEKLPSYKNFFMQQESANEPAIAEYSSQSPTTQSLPENPESLHSVEASPVSPMHKRDASLRSVQIMAVAAQQTQELRAQQAATEPLPVLVEADSETEVDEKQAEVVSTSSSVKTAEQKQEADAKQTEPQRNEEAAELTAELNPQPVPQFKKTPRRYSPGLSGHPVIREDEPLAQYFHSRASPPETEAAATAAPILAQYVAYRPGTPVGVPEQTTTRDPAQSIQLNPEASASQGADRQSADFTSINLQNSSLQADTRGEELWLPSSPPARFATPVGGLKVGSTSVPRTARTPVLRPNSEVPPPVPRKDTVKAGIRRVVNPRAVRNESTSSIQPEPPTNELTTVPSQRAQRGDSQGSTSSSLSQPEPSTNAELARQLSEKSVESASLDAIRARVAGMSQRTATAIDVTSMDDRSLIAKLEDLGRQTEALHQRYTGMRVERQKLSSSITTSLRERKAEPEYANTLLDQHMALSAIVSSMDICFAKLKSLDCQKEDTISALLVQVRRKTSSASNKSKAVSAKNGTSRDLTDKAGRAKIPRVPVERRHGSPKAGEQNMESAALQTNKPQVSPKQTSQDTAKSTSQGAPIVEGTKGDNADAAGGTHLVVKLASRRHSRTPPPQRPLPAPQRNERVLSIPYKPVWYLQHPRPMTKIS